MVRYDFTEGNQIDGAIKSGATFEEILGVF